ncbi:MAG: STAS domain-containing protein, partial [Acidobacteriota bacterium]
VNYVSSAGLRVFISTQKRLRKAGGEIILYRIPRQVEQVFETAGFMAVFGTAQSHEEIEARTGGAGSEPPVARTINGIGFQIEQRRAEAGRLTTVGSVRPLADSGYAEGDVIGVRPGAFRFGVGLATLGDDFQDYGNLFGEALVVDHSLFFYPAVKRAAVDFMLASGNEDDMEYRFLHGFGFSGSMKYVAFFERTDGFIELSRLVDSLFEISDANVLGIVLLAESKGLWGMHLRRSPIEANRPPNGKPIFDAENFPDWMNFPVEPGDINHSVLATGIAVRERKSAPEGLLDHLPQDSNFHIHAGVFSREPIGKRIDRFEAEVRRTMTELDVLKVQHILGQSAFSWGIAGIVEIKG